MKNKYDSFLFGYGLTIKLFNELQKAIQISSSIKIYLNFNHFLKDFLFKPTHSVIWRDFNNLFDLHDKDTISHRIKSKEALKLRFDEIINFGFEKWVSKFLFDPEKEVDKDLIVFMYLLYNYWSSILYKGLLTRSLVIDFFNFKFDTLFKLIKFGKIYTTNFDIYFDNFFKIDHIHGKFILPLNRYKELITLYPKDKNRFEYSYLFGGGGLEKFNRLNEINNLKINSYDLDFFYNSSINLGDLLIFGLSFSKTEYITDAFLEKYPKYKRDFLFLSIDGHILKILN